jgi:O-acetyl-ADP-ribose deacetylase (regulator of RNase III)
MEIMIRIGKGNLLEADVEALVNTVNCVGVMGKGIALQFKRAFPLNFKQYKDACNAGEVQPGRMLLTKVSDEQFPKYIINFPTKRHWKGKSNLDDIRSGLLALVDEVKKNDIRSIALPPLGCGNGGLDWQDVEPLIQAAFATLPNVEAIIFPPTDAPQSKSMIVRTEKPKMTLGRAILICLIDKYRSQDYELTKLEVQKVAYFAQAAGQPLKLNFVRDKFGPYAENLNHVMEAMEGHYIIGSGDRSQRAEISLLPDASDDASRFLQDNDEVLERIQRVSLLIEGFETPYGMELLATTHMVAAENPDAMSNVDIAVKEVHNWSKFKSDWSKRKRDMFSPDHIKIAWESLKTQGWLQ